TGPLPRNGEPAVRLRTAPGTSKFHSEQRASESPAVPPGVRCENGVCTLTDRAFTDSPPLPTPMSAAGLSPAGPAQLATAAKPDPAVPALTWQLARERLQELGASQFRLETGSRLGEFRFACWVNERAQTKQFTATAPTDMEAVERVLEQIEAWRRT